MEPIVYTVYIMFVMHVQLTILGELECQQINFYSIEIQPCVEKKTFTG